MHNLRRVAAGLRGEYLEPEATPEPEEKEQDSKASNWKGKGKKSRRGADIIDGAQNEWQDMSEFEREEAEIEVGEIGDRVNVVREGGDAPKVEVTGGAEQDGKKRKKGGDGEGVVDKETRKKAKKARHKEEKAMKEKARAGKSK